MKSKRLTALEASDLAHCRALLRDGSKSFFAASKLLPKRVRVPVIALYAFCRVWDDAVDLVDDKQAAIKELSERLDDIYAGAILQSPVDRGFAAVAQHYAIPRALPQALLEGFEWDAVSRRYRDIHELEDYAARVAGSVGAMMTLVMGVRDPVALARATDLGVAMQLTNIARDIGEDAREGRLYIPLEWLQEFQIDVEKFLQSPIFDSRIAVITERLLLRATALYERGSTGITLLPFACRTAIGAAQRIYAEIGVNIESMKFNTIDRRAVVPFSRKLNLLVTSLSDMFGPNGPAINMPPIAANRYLIESIPRKEIRLRGFLQKFDFVMDALMKRDDFRQREVGY